MAEFLDECLLADTLLLEQWGDEAALPSLVDLLPSTSQDFESASAALDPLERRRQLNRDAMRLVRQKAQRRVERMRGMLSALAQEFNELRERQRTAAERTELANSFATLAATSHTLKAEKLHLEHKLMDFEMRKLRIEGAVDSFSAASRDLVEPAEQYFEYVAITKDQAQAAIHSTHGRISELEQTARPLADWVGSVGSPASTFGWSVKCEISSGHNFFLSMTKRLAKVRPNQATQRSWTFITRARQQSDNGPTRRAQQIVRSDFLQALDENMVVVGNDWYHPVKPGVRMRSIGLRFRTKTERGFALGVGSVNPQDPVTRAASPSIEYRDGFTWQDYEADGDGGCVVTFKSLVQYDTLENLHQRLVNIMSQYWQWENDILQCSAAKLLTSNE